MRVSNTLSVVLTTLASSPAVSAYGNPQACSGVCNNAHDPSIIRRQSDGTYFRFSTGNKVAIHTAPTLSGPWIYKCAMLPSGSSIKLAGNQDLWAPDVVQVGSTYYVTYSVSAFGDNNSGIGLATSTTMDCGSFKDLGTTGVESRDGDDYNAIDSQIFKDGNNYQMNFGSFWSNLYQVSMANPPLKSTGSKRQLSFEPAGTHPEEAAYMVKNGNYYYLFYSVGSCCGYDTNRPAAGAEYKIKVCRSSSATGSFVSRNLIVMHSVERLLMMTSRSTLRVNLAFRAVEPLCSSPTATYTALVDKASTTIRSKAGSCTTTTSTPTLATLMDRSSSGGTRFLGTMAGRRCRSHAGRWLMNMHTTTQYMCIVCILVSRVISRLRDVFQPKRQIGEPCMASSMLETSFCVIIPIAGMFVGSLASDDASCCDFSLCRKDSEALDLPICVLERSSIVRHKAITSSWTVALAAVDRLSSGPVATERNVHDDVGVPEVIANVTVCIRKIGRRLSPSGWIRCGRRVREIAGLIAATEEPHTDAVVSPLGGIHTATILIEC
jgi:arabinan endo-1,5-alpha-L-arabinosidase